MRYFFLFCFTLASFFPLKSQVIYDDTELISFFSANGFEEKILALEKWGGKMLREFPAAAVHSTGNLDYAEEGMINLLFVDEVFVPVFGAPIDAIGYKERDKMVNFAISVITNPLSKMPLKERRARVEWIRHLLLQMSIPSIYKGKKRQVYSTEHKMIIKKTNDLRAARKKYIAFYRDLSGSAPVDYRQLETFESALPGIRYELWPSEKNQLLLLIQQRKKQLEEQRRTPLLAAYQRLAEAEKLTGDRTALNAFIHTLQREEPHMIKQLEPMLSERNTEIRLEELNAALLELENLQKNGVLLSELNNWHSEFLVEQLGKSNRNGTIQTYFNKVMAKFFAIQTALLQQNKNEIYQKINAAETLRALEAIKIEYFGNGILEGREYSAYRQGNGIYPAFQSAFDEREEILQPYLGRFSKPQLSRILLEETETGEPTAQQIEVAYMLKVKYMLDQTYLEAYLKNYPDFEGDTGREGVSGIIILLLGDRKFDQETKVEVLSITKHNCSKVAGSEEAYRCEYTVEMKAEGGLVGEFLKFQNQLFNTGNKYRGYNTFVKSKGGWLILEK